MLVCDVDVLMVMTCIMVVEEAEEEEAAAAAPLLLAEAPFINAAWVSRSRCISDTGGALWSSCSCSLIIHSEKLPWAWASPSPCACACASPDPWCEGGPMLRSRTMGNIPCPGVDPVPSCPSPCSNCEYLLCIEGMAECMTRLRW